MMGSGLSPGLSRKKDMKVRDEPDMPVESVIEVPVDGLADSKQAQLEDRLQSLVNDIEYLQTNDDYATEECLNIYDNLKRACMMKPKSSRVIVGEHLASLGYCEIFPKMWKDLNSYDLFAEEPTQKAKQALINLKRLKVSYWNFTDCSSLICQQMGKYKCLDLLMEDLRNPELKVDKLSDDSRRYLIKGSLGIIHNCCRKVPDNCPLCYGAIDILQELTTSSYLIVRAKAFIILAYVVKKTEIHKLGTNNSCMSFLLKMLEEALGNKSHTTKKYGFSALETLQGINQLAVNDENKLLVVELGGLPLMAAMLERNCTIKEQQNAAEGVWQLAFLDQNKEKIRQNQHLIKSLMFLKNSEEPAVRDASTGALWEIYDSKVPLGVHNDKSPRSISSSTLLSTESDAPHIMISYQWDCQDRMIEVKELLTQAGYNVWMDIDKMEGDILGAMAQAVEKSAIVLVCMTQKYSESHNGRTEATYAYKLKKSIIPLQLEDGFQPEGWLGALVGTLLYFKMFSDEQMKENLPGLKREMGDRGKMPKKSVVKPNGIPPQKSFISTSPPPRPKSPALPPKSVGKTAISKWGPDQVQTWLDTNAVGNLNENLRSMNGEQLIQLRKQLARAPEFFHRSLKDDLKLSFLDILRLTAALDKLPI